MSRDAWILLLLGLTAVTAVAVLRLRSMSRQAVPLADAASLRREAVRTAGLRIACGLLLTALAAACLAVAPHGVSAASGPTRRYASTIVVLDVSGSITQPAFRKIVRTLDAVSNATVGRRAGLIVFSDVAQEALPPETSASELRGFNRFFIPLPRAEQTPGTATQFPQNPWFAKFSGGTVISSGLALARAAAHRDHVPHARVILVSDLSDDASDSAALDRELRLYASDPLVDLRVTPVPPTAPADIDRFRSALGASTIAPTPGASVLVAPGSSGTLDVPVTLLVVVGLVALALALNETAAATLVWKRRTEPEPAR